MSRRMTAFLFMMMLTTGAMAQDCTPPDWPAADNILVDFHARLLEGGTVPVTVLGGGFTAAGRHTGTSYPDLLERMLEARFAGTDIRLTTVAEPGATVADALEFIRHLPAGSLPALALWEVGGGDAAHSLDVEEFARMLDSGLAWFQQAGIPVVLIVPSLSEAGALLANLQPYAQAAQQIGLAWEIPVLERESGQGGATAPQCSAEALAKWLAGTEPSAVDAALSEQ